MLFIAYKQKQQSQPIKIPPIFLQITQDILNWEIQHLIKYVYQQFKCYLSPFVTSEHLKLQLANKEILYRKTPLFLYLNYGKYMQQLFCSIGSIESIKEENQITNTHKHTLIMRISNRGEERCENKLIFERLKSCEDLKFNEIIKPQDKILMEGRQRKINLDKKWLISNWKKYENKANQCLYICIDRPAE